MAKSKNEIEAACNDFLADWNRGDWMTEHGEWDDEEDCVEEGTIDPDNVESDASDLGVGHHGQGWNCSEGWRAHQNGDALVLNWYRINCCDGRHARYLWIVIDDKFFEEDAD